jgi:hypothetical protein
MARFTSNPTVSNLFERDVARPMAPSNLQDSRGQKEDPRDTRFLHVRGNHEEMYEAGAKRERNQRQDQVFRICSAFSGRLGESEGRMLYHQGLIDRYTSGLEVIVIANVLGPARRRTFLTTPHTPRREPELILSPVWVGGRDKGTVEVMMDGR